MNALLELVVHEDAAQVAFRQACKHGQVDALRMLLSIDGDLRVDPRELDDRAYRQAIRAGKLNIVDLFLSQEGPSSVQRQTVLLKGVLESIEAGQVEVFERLLPLVCEQPGGFYGIFMPVPLPYACLHGSLPIVILLLELEGDHAQDVNHDFGGPLRMACRGGHAHIAKHLLALEAPR